MLVYHHIWNHSHQLLPFSLHIGSFIPLKLPFFVSKMIFFLQSINKKFQPWYFSICLPLLIRFEPNLKFHSHIHNIVSKAKQRASLIHRSFLSRDVATLKRAFVVYVRPLLEYSAQVWSPSLITLINEIEKVQKIFTKRLPGLLNLNYCERLQILKLKSLEHRRLIIDLVTCYNIIHNNITITRKNFFTFSTSTNLRGHPFRLSILIIKNNTHRSFFSVRTIKIWNALPTEIVTAKNINIFKSRLNQHDLSKFLIGPSYSLCPQ